MSACAALGAGTFTVRQQAGELGTIPDFFDCGRVVNGSTRRDGYAASR